MSEITYILLTGAGFSANFNGYLANQMWGKIFNHPNVQSNETLLQEMRKEILESLSGKALDYESLYTAKTKKPGEMRDAIINATHSAYEANEGRIKSFLNSPNFEIKSCVDELIKLFLKGDRPSTIFTLNQDLFFERCVEINNLNFEFLGLGSNHNHRITQYQSNLFTIEETYNLENQSPNNAYIKLHGSINWREKNNSKVMVIGKTKKSDIYSNSLLSNYFNIFKKTLCQNNVHLLVIGYGFMDEHINEVILNAISQFQIKLYIVDPISIEDFFKKIKKSFSTEKNVQNLIGGICGYYQNTLSDFFLPSGESTWDWRDLKNNFWSTRK